MARRLVVVRRVALAAAGAGAVYVASDEEVRRRLRSSWVYWGVADVGAWSLRTLVRDAETAHAWTLKSLRLGLGPVAPARELGALETECLGGLRFASPIGIAAGFDKKAEAVAALGDAGFGFVEVGGVTPTAQEGNPRPRIFRFPDEEAVVNRVGLPSEGVDAVARRLATSSSSSSSSSRKTTRCLVGVNCAKQTSVDDYAVVAGAVSDHVDFVVINASCPNVGGGVVADLGELRRAVRATRKKTTKPVLVKVSPDVDDVKALAKALLAERVDGVVVANTSKKHSFPENGGLSGRPLTLNTRHLVADVYRHTQGKLLIVGVGGVFSADDAYALVRAGATLVQLYTGLVYLAPSKALRLHADLNDLLLRDGFNTLAQAVGVDAHLYPPGAPRRR